VALAVLASIEISFLLEEEGEVDRAGKDRQTYVGQFMPKINVIEPHIRSIASRDRR
jgi:hypothetical protein